MYIECIVADLEKNPIDFEVKRLKIKSNLEFFTSL